MHPNTRCTYIILLLGFFNHGYEFMGSNKNIVITPLTNRIFLTFTQALMMNLGGATHGMNHLYKFNLSNLILQYEELRAAIKLLNLVNFMIKQIFFS